MSNNPPLETRKKVLIVEDNELNLKLVNDLLEYHGYLIFTTDRGAATLEMARQHRPDLIIMDIQLPDITGMEAARRLKADQNTNDSDCRSHCFRYERRSSQGPRQRVRRLCGEALQCIRTSKIGTTVHASGS